MSWCAGFSRLGGTGGPLVGLLIGAGLSFHAILWAYLALRRSARLDPARCRVAAVARHDHDACGAGTQDRTGYGNRPLNPVPLMLSRTWDVVRWRQPMYERILVEST